MSLIWFLPQILTLQSLTIPVETPEGFDVPKRRCAARLDVRRPNDWRLCDRRLYVWWCVAWRHIVRWRNGRILTFVRPFKAWRFICGGHIIERLRKLWYFSLPNRHKHNSTYNPGKKLPQFFDLFPLIYMWVDIDFRSFRDWEAGWIPLRHNKKIYVGVITFF